MAEATPMNIIRFREIMASYGANPGRWPERDRAAAIELLARSSEAQALQHEAARLDHLLEQVSAPVPSPELRADILAAAFPSPWWQWAAVLWPFGPLWKPVTVLITAALIGVMLGLLVEPPAMRTLISEEIASLM